MNIMTVFFFFFLSCSSYIIHSHFATMSHWYVYNLRYYDSNNNKNKLMNFFFFFTYRYITSGKSWMERWLREYLFSSSLLQIGLKRIRISLYDKSHLADQRSNYHSWYPNHVSILAQYKFQFVPINFSRFSLSFVFPLFTLLVIHSVKRNVESRS